MSPKLARCMVNLTRIKNSDRLLDPFCGTGGIIIEAGIIGARVVGTDIDPKMVIGTIENLQHCDIKDYEVFQADARKLKLPYEVDGVATDPPYGIQHPLKVRTAVNSTRSIIIIRKFNKR